MKFELSTIIHRKILHIYYNMYNGRLKIIHKPVKIITLEYKYVKCNCL